MRALVTGGTGFVGGHLIDLLRLNGHEVTALVRSAAKAERIVGLGVRAIHGDLGDRDALEQASQSQDVVFHVAGVVAAHGEREYVRVNREGTRNVLRAATRAGVSRLLLVSSLAAAGPSSRGRPLVGHEAPAPVTAYGRSKLAAEDLVRRGELPWTIVRPPMVYGPRDTEVLKVFRVARTGLLPVFGSRDQELSTVFVTDLASALLYAAEAFAAVRRTYYACHPETITSEEFVRIAAEAVGRRRNIVIRLPGPLTRGLLTLTGAAARMAGRSTILNRDKASELLQPAWTCDPRLLSRDTGWQATTDVRSGVASTVAWYRENGWL